MATIVEQLKAAGLKVKETESGEGLGIYSFETLTLAEIEIYQSIVNPQLIKTEEVFVLPLRAPSITVDDIFVESRNIKDDPDEAFTEALAEAGKKKGQAKSLDLILRSSVKMIEKLQKQMDKLDKGK